MKEKIKEKFISVHSYLEKSFYFFIIGMFDSVGIILEILSFSYPIVETWTDIIDKQFNLISTFGYILIGIFFFYVSSTLKKITKDSLKQNSIKLPSIFRFFD